MTLGEAIRNGSAGRKQIRGQFFKLNATGSSVVGCCAAGAAVLGIVGEEQVLRQANKRDFFSLREWAASILDEHFYDRRRLAGLNDMDELSFEEIAARADEWDECQ